MKIWLNLTFLSSIFFRKGFFKEFKNGHLQVKLVIIPYDAIFDFMLSKL